MTTTKAVNYTDDQVSKMVKTYQAADTDAARKEAVQVIASELGKHTRSVIAKLSNLKVYVTPEKVTKSGAKVITKEEVVTDIASKLDLDFEAVKSLGKATKAALELVKNSIS